MCKHYRNPTRNPRACENLLMRLIMNFQLHWLGKSEHIKNIMIDRWDEY